MSRRTIRIEQENFKLRNELAKLKTELKDIKKSQGQSLIFKSEVQTKIASIIQEKVEVGIFSPPKLPISRPKSPISKPLCKSPNQNSKICKFPDENKENKLIDEYALSKSPEFTNQYTTKSIDPSSFFEFNALAKDTSRVDLNELQSLEKENNLLKELNRLRNENEILRTQVKNPKNLSNPLRINEKIKRNSKNHKHSMDELSLNCSLKKKIIKKSPKPTTNNNNTSYFSKKLSLSKASHCESKINLDHQISRINKRQANDSFSESFYFTKSKRGINKVTGVSRKIFGRSYALNSSFELSYSRLSPNITPRNKSCNNCDILLHKGLSTSFCSKHIC